MKIAVLGTGMVGKTIGNKLIWLGHEVRMGSRRADNDNAVIWTEEAGRNASHGTFADAAQFGDMIFNCTKGDASIAALEAAGSSNLAGKILVDLSNPLDFSKGMPPSLFVSNTDSLGEQIQRAFPDVRVVKSLNTLWCGLMVDPGMIQDGDHHIFVCGNDGVARQSVADLLHTFGWKKENILDLGDLSAARGTEMMLPVWLRIYGAKNTGAFNFKIVSA